MAIGNSLATDGHGQNAERIAFEFPAAATAFDKVLSISFQAYSFCV